MNSLPKRAKSLSPHQATPRIQVWAMVRARSPWFSTVTLTCVQLVLATGKASPRTRRQSLFPNLLMSVLREVYVRGSSLIMYSRVLREKEEKGEKDW